jgi:chlorite dismutase
MAQRREFEGAVERDQAKDFTFSVVGLKKGADLLLWRIAQSVEALQEGAAAMLRIGMGRSLEIAYVYTGMVRPSTYIRNRTPQEQAVGSSQKLKYLIVYPFTKTVDWYLLGRDIRQRVMDEHIRIGRRYPSVRQTLVHSFGLDDQEFVVAYETDDLRTFQELVMEMRETEARRYTLRDTPIFVAVRRDLGEALELLG